MNYAALKKMDVANGPGLRVSLFVSGCNHRCKNCFNQEAWDFHFGKPFTQDTAEEVLACLGREHIAGLTVLGGEPFERPNQQGLLPLLKEAKERFPQKQIWCYSGYDFEKEILAMAEKWEETKEMLSYIDILVDGRFVEELKDLSLRFRGSSNQRILKVKESLEKGQIVLWEGMLGSGES